MANKSSYDVDTFYNDLNKMGLQYYKQFKVVQEIHFSDRTIIARIENNLSEAENNKYFIHPAILDGGLQTMAVLFNKLSYSN